MRREGFGFSESDAALIENSAATPTSRTQLPSKADLKIIMMGLREATKVHSLRDIEALSHQPMRRGSNSHMAVTLVKAKNPDPVANQQSASSTAIS